MVKEKGGGMTRGCRRSRREKRQREAIERQSRREKRTPQEQLQILDQRLGPGIGAERERARLTSMIEQG